MSEITNLSREIVQEIQNLTHQSVSVEDYLKIRASAVQEIRCGFYESNTYETKTVVPFTAPAKIEQNDTNIVSKNKDSNETQKQTNKQVVTNSDEPDWFEDSKSSTEDPFFALCNKL